jgi:hypothetical protein
MSQPLLLDEMFSDDIARQLRAKGCDVISLVADPALAGLPDDQILASGAGLSRLKRLPAGPKFIPGLGPYRTEAADVEALSPELIEYYSHDFRAGAGARFDSRPGAFRARQDVQAISGLQIAEGLPQPCGIPEQERGTDERDRVSYSPAETGHDDSRPK